MYYLLNIVVFVLGLATVCGGAWGVLGGALDVPAGFGIMVGGLAIVAAIVGLQPFFAANRLRVVAEALGGRRETHRDAEAWFRGLDRLLDPADTRDFRLHRVVDIPWNGRTGTVDLAWWWHTRLQPASAVHNIAHLDLVVRLSAECAVALQVLPVGRGSRLAGHGPIPAEGRLDARYMVFAPRPEEVLAFLDPSLTPALDQAFRGLRAQLFPGAAARLLLFPGGVAALIQNASADVLHPHRLQGILAALAPLADAAERRSRQLAAP